MSSTIHITVAPSGADPSGPARLWTSAVVAVSCLLAVACSRPGHAPASRAAAASHEDSPAARVTAWIGGDRQRMVRRKVRAAARLLVLPQSGPGQPLTDHCVPASSLLPSRAQPGTIFLIIAGALHVIDTRAAHPAIVPVEIMPAGISFVQLLASSKQASPTVLLALVQTDSAQPAARPGAGTLWRFEVEATWATGTPAREGAWLESREAFFDEFHAPRCRDDGRDCLVVADRRQGAFLDVQPRPRAPRQAWKALPAGRIHDAAWLPGGDGSALALVTCEESAPADR